MRDFFNPPWEQTDIVLVPESVLARAERGLSSCEACATEAELPFDYVLDQMTGCDPSVTDYVLSRPGRCPRCRNIVLEKTLVVWESDDSSDDAAPVPPSPV